MSESPALRSLVDLTARRSSSNGAELAYTFLLDGEQDTATIDYSELHRRARRVAVALRRLRVGDRALLLYPPGLDFMVGFLGCLHAGVIAVPAYPPDLARLARSLPRLQAIAAKSGATVVLTTQPIVELAAMIAGQAPDLANLEWMATDALPVGSEDEWKDPNVDASHVAFLQYTSGSTGTPKGVIVTHGNLLANLEGTYELCFRGAKDDVYVGWLPPYHDMGLIGQLLQPLYAGYPCVTMSPLHFLQRPLRWLQAVTRYRGTTSASPNFAFDLCVRKTTPEERAELDLSSWRVVFNGAEPINAATLDQFSETFAPCGFRRKAFYPAYGLAESTLMICGGARETEPVVEAIDPVAFEDGRAAPAREAENARLLVGIGRAAPEHEIVVVGSDGAAAPPRTIGEIYVAGPSIANGYWEEPEQTTQTFAGRVAGSDRGPYLRTGDLGFLREDAILFVTGRSKDVVIVRGRNFFPTDIERVVEASHFSVRRGCTAAFALVEGGDERLVIVAEVERRFRERRAPPAPGEADRRTSGRRQEDADPTGDPEQRIVFDPVVTVNAINQAVASELGVRPAEILLLKAGTIPKTSSGKLQRYLCREGYRDGSLDVVYRPEKL